MKNTYYEVFYIEEKIDTETGEIKKKRHTVIFSHKTEAFFFYSKKQKENKEAYIYKVEQINKMKVATPLKREV